MKKEIPISNEVYARAERFLERHPEINIKSVDHLAELAVIDFMKKNSPILGKTKIKSVDHLAELAITEFIKKNSPIPEKTT